MTYRGGVWYCGLYDGRVDVYDGNCPKQLWDPDEPMRITNNNERKFLQKSLSSSQSTDRPTNPVLLSCLRKAILPRRLERRSPNEFKQERWCGTQVWRQSVVRGMDAIGFLSWNERLWMMIL